MMSDQATVTIDHPILNDCWNQIGVMGDRSCGELKTVIHCHDCPVYAAVGDSLLEREPPANYVEEWISILAETTPEAEETESHGAILLAEEAISIMIFRLGEQKLAMPVRILQEVTHPCLIQPLPHRSNSLFLGLVNIRGETLLCASLSNLLSLETAQKAGRQSVSGTGTAKRAGMPQFFERSSERTRTLRPAHRKPVRSAISGSHHFAYATLR